jgi:hypothetical protein
MSDLSTSIDHERLAKIVHLAREFVEERDEATPNIWYCDGDKGRELLKALGIPYVEKS